MKTIKLFALLFILATLNQSCLRDNCTATRNYVQYNPVFMTGAELQYDISTNDLQVLENPGKIYFYNNYLFINEQGKGIHIYNNSQPENPVYVKFYNIPGNFDLAIRNDILYADNPLYLMAINIEDIENPVLESRSRLYNYEWYYENEDYTHVIYYTRSNIVETIDCSDPFWNDPWFNRGGAVFLDVAVAESFDVLNSNTTQNDGGNVGVGGSTARFTIYDHFLYTVDHSSLNVWNIQNATIPEKVSSKNMGWGIETIFPYEDKLFIGSMTGMFIYDNSNPENPVLASEFRHAAACDPVVVQGERAYVTLREGTACNGFDNQLDVLNIKDIYNPTLIKSYDMKHPHGLAIRNDHLFICEGSYGLKVFDASDDLRITNNELAYLKDIHAVDVISLTDKLIFVVGEDGFFQYNVHDIEHPRLISSIIANP